MFYFSAINPPPIAFMLWYPIITLSNEFILFLKTSFPSPSLGMQHKFKKTSFPNSDLGTANVKSKYKNLFPKPQLGKAKHKFNKNLFPKPQLGKAKNEFVNHKFNLFFPLFK